VFPHAYLWLGPRSCFLVGLKKTLLLDLAHVQRVLDAPAAAGLRRHGWHDAAELAALLLADGGALARWVGEGPVSSVEHPLLEFYALHDAPPEEDRVATNLAALAGLRRQGLQDARFTGSDEDVVANARAVGLLLDGLILLARQDDSGARVLETALAHAPATAGMVRQTAAEALFELGRSNDVLGRTAAAGALYTAASVAWPGFAEAHVNLGRIAAIHGRRDEATARLLRALEINPMSGSAHRMLGELLSKEDPARAIPHLREAVRLAPAMAELHEELGLSLAMTSQVDDALVEFREALRLAPDWPAALDRVALILATHPEPRIRDPDEAVRLARRAMELTDGKDPMTLEVVAAAYASAGRFAEAESSERKVLDIAVATGNDVLARAAQAAMERYRRGLALPAGGPAKPD
jgi:spermidine synthase